MVYDDATERRGVRVGNNEAVLLVSENTEFLLSMFEALHDDGYAVAATSTTDEAVAAIGLCPPNVIVLDLTGTIATAANFWRLRAASWSARLIVIGDEASPAA